MKDKLSWKKADLKPSWNVEIRSGEIVMVAARVRHWNGARDKASFSGSFTLDELPHLD
jgi:hypothetical protein